MQQQIVIVINSTIDKHGSMEDFMLHCAIKARSLGWKLIFIFPEIRTTAVRDLLEFNGAETIVLGDSWKESRARNRELIKHIERIHPDIVNFHFCGSLDFIKVYRFARRHGARVVWHYHGEIRPLSTLKWRNRHFSALRFISLFTDLMIPVSDANDRFLRALHVHCLTKRIYNGIDCDSFAAVPPLHSSERTELLYVGSLIERKRVDFLIRAFEELSKMHPEVHLSIVGGGHLAGSVRELVERMDRPSSVSLLGQIKEFPYELFQRSDLFVSASSSESFGLVFAEAMIKCLPVVACNIGGIPEVVLDGVTGLLAPVDDFDAFVSALSGLVSSAELRRRFGRAGREHVLKNFNLPNRVDDLFETFSTIRDDCGGSQRLRHPPSAQMGPVEIESQWTADVETEQCQRC